MQTIYADVLIVLNTYISFFLLRITARLTHTPLRRGRCAAGSVLGGISSLLILLPPVGVPLLAVIRLSSACCICLAAFGFISIRRLIVNTAAFLCANILLAGLVYAVYSWLRPGLIVVGSGYFYVHFSLLVLILTTAGAYLIITAAGRLADSSSPGDWQVIIRYKTKLISVSGLADTGDLLTDIFTGLPVVICGKEVFRELTGREPELYDLPPGFRLIPYTTASDSSTAGLIPVFRPDEVLIKDTATGERKPADVLVGFGSCGRKAIFNPRIVRTLRF
ncbi:MAG: sigma-E processing peptidase SpoIIGA [Ruminococcus sp.]|nr:sigma-E processing peptidase SpoIIGA [Ruminococcus sp.]